MKKIINILLICTMLLLCTGQAVYGETVKIQADFSSPNVYINSILLNVKIITYNNMKYVSLNDMCYYLNSSVEYDNINKTANILTDKRPSGKIALVSKTLSNGIKSIDAAMNPYVIQANGVETYLDSFSYKNAVFVPLQYLVEIYGKILQSSAKSNSVNINDISQKVIGSVNGEAITQEDLDFLYNLQAKSSLQSADGNVDPQTEKDAKSQIFDVLTDRKVLLQKSAESKIVLSLEDLKNINTNIKQIVDQNGGIATFRKFLTDNGVTYSRFSKYISDDYIINNIFIPQLVRLVESSDEDNSQYYEAYKSSYVNPETVKVKHILIMTQDASGVPYTQDKKGEAKKRAEDILAKIKAGEDFDKLMNTYSEDPGLKSYPDGYTFSKGQMVKEFEDAAFSLNVGEASGLVETIYGYHILKVEEKTLQKQLSHDEVKSQIKSNLDNTEKQKFYNNIMKYWKSKIKIENLME